MTDPISDFLTRIRNAQMARHSQTLVPYSKLKEEIARVMKKNKFLEDYSINEEGQFPQLCLILPERKLSLKRVSKPGQRINVKSVNIQKVLHGLGISIVSTSKGVMTGYEARSLNVGGEILCDIS